MALLPISNTLPSITTIKAGQYVLYIVKLLDIVQDVSGSQIPEPSHVDNKAYTKN